MERSYSVESVAHLAAVLISGHGDGDRALESSDTRARFVAGAIALLDEAVLQLTPPVEVPSEEPVIEAVKTEG